MTNLLVLTSARPTQPFEHLRRTVEQVDDEGIPAGTTKGIVLDGTVDDLVVAQATCPAPGWSWFRFEKPAGAMLGGNKLSYWHLLRVALDLGDDALALEDDLTHCQHAVTRALLFPVPPDVDVLQFFSAWTLTDPKMHPGLWRTPSVVAGCQAIKFPRRTLQRLVDWQAQDAEFGKYTGSDQALNLSRSRLRLRVANHCPDLFQHAGEESAVDAGTMVEMNVVDEDSVRAARHSLQGRTSVTWPGKGFDAMRLFARHELFT